MQTDNLNSLIAQWARDDAHMPAGYEAPASVLQERLLGVELATLQSALRGIRADVWTEREGGRFHVGFRDNRASAEYNALLSHVGARARQLGWAARLQKPQNGRAHATLAIRPPDLASTASAAHHLYVRALETERAAVALHRLGA